MDSQWTSTLPPEVRTPKRRNSVAIRRVLASHTPGELLEARFTHHVFGTYTVRGYTYTTATGLLAIGTHLLTTGESRPAKDLVVLRTIQHANVSRGAPASPEEASVGSIVLALCRYKQQQIAVTGFVVGQRLATSTGVGRHLLTSRNYPLGHAEILKVEVIAASMPFGQPEPVSSWTDADAHRNSRSRRHIRSEIDVKPL